jgi:uncharacterized coiled-coil protein SlyX
MKSFTRTINEKGRSGFGEAQDSMLANWLTLITVKDIEDKTIIKSICEEQEEIGMAVSTLVRLSEDKLTRQEYLKRQDDIMLQNQKERRLVELETTIADQSTTIADQNTTVADQARENEQLRQQLAELRAQISKK